MVCRRQTQCYYHRPNVRACPSQYLHLSSVGCTRRRDCPSCSSTLFYLKSSHLRHPSSSSNLYLSLHCTTKSSRRSTQTRSRRSTKSKRRSSKRSTRLTKMCLLALPQAVERPYVLNLHCSSYGIKRMTRERFVWSRIRRWSISVLRSAVASLVVCRVGRRL